jgi:hypothetical protein
MKQIGYVDGASSTAKPIAWKTHSLGMLLSYELYIPNPGERENVNAEQWLLIGWVNPDSDGGTIYPTHADFPHDGARPAYVRQSVLQQPQTTPQPPVPVEPPMTFYDHAFIAAWWSLSKSDYSDEVRAVRAHELASVILRYRQPRQ